MSKFKVLGFCDNCLSVIRVCDELAAQPYDTESNRIENPGLYECQVCGKAVHYSEIFQPSVELVD